MMLGAELIDDGRIGFRGKAGGNWGCCAAMG